MTDSYRRDALKKEIEILKTLDHPNVIRLIETIETSTRINIVMEYVKGKSLYQYIRKKPGMKIGNENECKQIFRQLAEGVCYLHKEKITHRDLKLENVLFDQENGVVKIIDFGFSVKGDRKLPFQCGTPHYMSPELALKKEHFGHPADIWALGVILFVMLTGKVPFYGDFEEDLYRKIAIGKY